MEYSCGCVGWVLRGQHKSLFQSVRSGSVRVIDLFEHLLAGWRGRMGEPGVIIGYTTASYLLLQFLFNSTPLFF